MCAQSLSELAVKYFKKNGYKIETNIALEGTSGTTQKFDLRVSKAISTHLVRIMDWNRTIGVNMIINVDKAASDVGVPRPMVIAEKFSDHAKAYANRMNITLLTRHDLVSGLGE